MTAQRIKPGVVFGRLTVIERIKTTGYGTAVWLCKCECGTVRNFFSAVLNAGAKSCGCLLKDVKLKQTQERAGDIIGRYFGKWLVLELLPKRSKSGGVYFLCKCTGCDTQHDVTSDTLLRGTSKQCAGCKFAHIPFCKNGHEIALCGRAVDGSCRDCVSDRSLFRNYGITRKEYNAILKTQNGCCAVCGKELVLERGKPGFGQQKLGRAELDHDHKKKGKAAVRGILCGGRWAGCNRKLGKIDNVEWLERVVSYLKNPPAPAVLTSQS